MENRKKLHDYSLCLIILVICNLFMFATSMISAMFDGIVDKAIEAVPGATVEIVKISFLVLLALEAILIIAQCYIGFTGLKVAKEPTAAKGYITVAKVFLVLSILSIVSLVYSIFTASAGSVTDMIVNAANSVIDVVIYFLYIKAANAVRMEVLGNQ